MALSADTLTEMQTLIAQVNYLSQIMVADAKNTSSELTAPTITALNDSIQTVLTYYDSLVPVPA